MTVTIDNKILSGVALCSGIAIGKLVFLSGVNKEVPHYTIPKEDLDKEVKRYRQALRDSRLEIKKLQQKLKKEAIPEGVAILEAHLQILKDPQLTQEIEAQIKKHKKNVESIFGQYIQKCQLQLNALKDPYFQERSHDIRDISHRVMSHLLKERQVSIANIPAGSIVFAKDLTPSLVAEINHSKIAGLISETGSTASHTAIVARAKGIPYVSSVPFEALNEAFNQTVIVDGRSGEVLLTPSQDTLKHFQKIQNDLASERLALDHMTELPSETIDGHMIGLSANIDVESELTMLHRYKGKGVGLYRSEFLFLNASTFPTEEEQYAIYRGIVEKMNGLPLIMRTFDIGGDKQHLMHTKTPKEGNSFLGCRAIRFLLKERDIFKSQLRAILRAAHKADVSIMFPMVSALSELRDAKAVVREVSQELTRKKIPHNKAVKIGCMIEVPSAAITADLLAKECDFLSIGTNDLVQYSLAVDRSDESLADFYTPTHPGIIRLIKMTVEAGAHAGIPVSICGEIAADKKFVPLLIGLGVRDLSVAARFLPHIKLAIRSTSFAKACELSKRALSLATAEEISAFLDKS